LRQRVNQPLPLHPFLAQNDRHADHDKVKQKDKRQPDKQRPDPGAVRYFRAGRQAFKKILD
jgi:hypothetical protein